MGKMQEKGLEISRRRQVEFMAFNITVLVQEMHESGIEPEFTKTRISL